MLEGYDYIPGIRVEGMMKRKKQKFENWLPLIIGGLLILVVVLFSELFRVNDILDYRTVNLKELALKFKDVRNENEFLTKKIIDYKFAMFATRLYEQKDSDFLETALISYKKAGEYNLDPYLVIAIIHRESNFNPKAQSFCAYGLMQINYEAWKKEMNIDLKRIFEKEYNIDLGLKIYKQYLEKAAGDPWLALLFYNNGESMPVDKTNWKYPGNVMSSRFMIVNGGIR